MLKTWLGLIAALAFVAGCTSMSGSPQAGGPVPQIQSAPGKAVIYVVRSRPDLSDLTATLKLNDQIVGSTYSGTYMRFEVAPGRHHITGYGHDNGAITLDVQPDRIYFVQHTVSGSWRATSPHSFFRVIDEARARAVMAGATNAAG